MDSCDVEPTLHVVTVYIFEGLEYGLQFSVENMVDICKSYITNEVDKENDTFSK